MAVNRRIGGSADRRIVRPLVLIALTAGLPVAAIGQAAPGNSRPWPVDLAHYAKWPGLAATGTMLTLGFLASRNAARLQDSVAADAANRRARNWILGGEIGLVATGAMFLLDLIHRDDGPQNIPFIPLRVFASPGRIGLSAAFGGPHGRQ